MLKRGHFSDLSISSYLLLREAGAWLACGILRLRKMSEQPCPSPKSRKPKIELKWPRFNKVSVHITSNALWKLGEVFFNENLTLFLLPQGDH